MGGGGLDSVKNGEEERVFKRKTYITLYRERVKHVGRKTNRFYKEYHYKNINTEYNLKKVGIYVHTIKNKKRNMTILNTYQSYVIIHVYALKTKYVILAFFVLVLFS